MAAGLLWPLVRPLRTFIRGNIFIRSASEAHGRVVSSPLVTRSNSKGSRSWREETVEFTTQYGGAIRTVAQHPDVGLEDRSGAEVTVFYDLNNPESCVAPANGHMVKPPLTMRTVTQSVGGLIAIGVFCFISMNMFQGFPGA